MSHYTNFDYQIHGMHTQSVTTCPLCNPPKPKESKVDQQATTIKVLAAKLDEAIDLLENTFYYSFDESVRVRAGEAAEQWRFFLAQLAEEEKLS